MTAVHSFVNSSFLCRFFILHPCFILRNDAPQCHSFPIVIITNPHPSPHNKDILHFPFFLSNSPKQTVTMNLKISNWRYRLWARMQGVETTLSSSREAYDAENKENAQLLVFDLYSGCVVLTNPPSPFTLDPSIGDVPYLHARSGTDSCSGTRIEQGRPNLYVFLPLLFALWSESEIW